LHDPSSARRAKRRSDDDETPSFAKRNRHRRRLAPAESLDAADGLPPGERWSTWDLPAHSERGPQPYPDWLVTDLAATDIELGVLKTGKEADVFLISRAVPGASGIGRACLLAAKRYRSAQHRQFHRDSEYLAGRRVRESRDNRAMANRSAVGLAMIAQQWASAEFAALRRLFEAGVPVPYPVQVIGTEILLEFIGEPDGTAAPRLADLRPDGAGLASLWAQLVEAARTLASFGLAHGDLSAYNLLVHHGRLVMIDLPQVIDVVSHPRGGEFLDRDAANVAAWFSARGLPGRPDGDTPGPAELAALLRYDARLDS
jgi:RIO kinase 1